MNKTIKSIVVIAISIPLFIFSISLIMESTSNLDKLDKEKQQSLPLFEESFGLSLQICDPDKRMSEKELQGCKEDMKFQLGQCDFYGHPDFCNDPRIDKINNKKSTPNTETSNLPEVQNPNQVEMKTYKNSFYGFSIDYPSHWSSQDATYENDILIFSDTDETKFGMPGFMILQDPNELATPLESFQTYLEQFDPKYSTTTIDSQNQITINGINTYEIKYKLKIKAPSLPESTASYFTGIAFIYDIPKNNIILYYSSDDNSRYSSFFPIFERMAQSFKILDPRVDEILTRTQPSTTTSDISVPANQNIEQQIQTPKLNRECQPDRLCVKPGDYLQYSFESPSYMEGRGVLTYYFKDYLDDDNISVQLVYVSDEGNRHEKIRTMNLVTGLLNEEPQGGDISVSSNTIPYALDKISPVNLSYENLPNVEITEKKFPGWYGGSYDRDTVFFESKDAGDFSVSVFVDKETRVIILSQHYIYGGYLVKNDVLKDTNIFPK